MGFVIFAMIFAVFGLIYYGIRLLGTVVFSVSAICCRNKKIPCIVFTSLAAVSSMSMANVGNSMLRNLLGEGRYTLFALFAAALFAVLAFSERRKWRLCMVLTITAVMIIMPVAVKILKMMKSLMGDGGYLIFSLFAAVLFLILTIGLRKKKQLCILFTVLTVVSFMPAAKGATDYVLGMAMDHIFFSQITSQASQDSEADVSSADGMIT